MSRTIEQWFYEQVLWRYWYVWHPIDAYRNRKYFRAEDAVTKALRTVEHQLNCGQVTDLTSEVLDALQEAKVLR